MANFQSYGNDIMVHTAALQRVAGTDTITGTAQPGVRQQAVKVPVRSRSWKQEKSLLINGSPYMEPVTEVNLLTVKEPDPVLILPQRQMNQPDTDWLTIMLFFNLVLLATIRTTFPKYLDNLVQSIFNYSTSYRMFEEKNYSVLHAAFRLEVYFYITISVFLFQLFNFYHISLPYQNVGLFLFSLALVLVYFVTKKLLYRALGLIVEGTGETSEYLFNMDNTNQVTGLALFPVVLLIAFFPFPNVAIPVLLGLFIVSSFYFLLLHRGFLILLRKQFSILYLFLYFCTLEFLPLVLLYKIVVL